MPPNRTRRDGPRRPDAVCVHSTAIKKKICRTVFKKGMGITHSDAVQKPFARFQKPGMNCVRIHCSFVARSVNCLKEK